MGSTRQVSLARINEDEALNKNEPYFSSAVNDQIRGGYRSDYGRPWQTTADHGCSDGQKAFAL
jgi:hypothetical protein